MSYDLRPLSLAELLDRSFGLYRRHFWLFVGIMAPTSLAMLIFSLAGQLLQGFAILPSEQQPGPELAAALAIGLILGGVVAMFVYWITYALALGATTIAVSEIYGGGTPGIAKAYAATRGRLGRLAWLMFLLFIRIFAVTMLLVFAFGVAVAVLSIVSPVLAAMAGFAVLAGGGLLFLWMLLRYAVSVPVAVLEDMGASDAIARSIELTRGSLLRVLVLFAFTLIVNYAALAIFQLPFALAAQIVGPATIAGFWLNLLGVLSGSIAAALTGPLAVVAMAVLYYDIRISKEGLDLELLVAAVTAAPPSAVSPSSAVLPG